MVKILSKLLSISCTQKNFNPSSTRLHLKNNLYHKYMESISTQSPPQIPQPKRFPVFPIFLTLLVLLLSASTAFLAWQNIQLRQQLTPATYEECIKIPSSHIQESYPSVCVTSDGKIFTQPLTDEQKQNLQPPIDTSNWKTYT